MPLIGVMFAAFASVGTTPESAVPVESEPMHRVVYTNRSVRVLDVLIPSHGRTLYHTHVNDIAGVTLEPGPTRTEEAGSAPADEPTDQTGDVWFDSRVRPATHRVTNLGDKPIRLVAVEILGPRHRSLEPSPDPAAGGRVELENSRVRVTRFVLAPNESLPGHSHRGTYVLVALGPGRLARACGGADPFSITQAGLVCVGDEPRDLISNVGDRPLVLFEFEVAP